MRVLALDTATEACSVALLVDGDCVRRFSEVGRGHAEEILPMVDAVLAEAGTSLAMLDGLAASVGPGSFTGVRVSISVAQGLAFGAELPVIPITTLEALAAQAVRGGADQVLACLDARMGELYWGCFNAQAQRGVSACGPLAVGAAGSVVPSQGGSVHGIGRGFAAYPILELIPALRLAPGSRDALPDALDIATLGALRLALGEGIDPAALAPVYLRDKVALTEVERAAAMTAGRSEPERGG